MAEYEPMKECSACCEQHPVFEMLAIDNDDVCASCIRDLFSNAITDESNYPPRWGSIELNPWDFPLVVGDDIIRDYVQKTAKYNIPWSNRVYCATRQASGDQCGAYLGEKTATPLRQACLKCRTLVCMCCKDRILPLIIHQCDTSAAEDEKDFDGLVRGKDFQKCPNCHNKFQLRDGCNHVHCFACNQSLCFICGAPADGNSNHWNRSGGSRCPRYNQPGTASAIFESDGGESDESDEEDNMFGTVDPRHLMNHIDRIVIEPSMFDRVMAERDAEARETVIVGREVISPRERPAAALRRMSMGLPPFHAPPAPPARPGPRQRALPRPTNEVQQPRSSSEPRPRATQHAQAHHRARHAPLHHSHAHPVPAATGAYQRTRHAPLQHSHAHQPAPTQSTTQSTEHSHAHYRGRHTPLAEPGSSMHVDHNIEVQRTISFQHPDIPWT